MPLEKIAEKARHFLSLASAVALIGTIGLFVAENDKVKNKIGQLAGTPQLIEQIQEAKKEIEETNDKISEISNKIDLIEVIDNESSEPPMVFTLDGNFITNGDIGNLVTIEVSYRQTRDCGRPFIAVAFRNGGEIVHNFIDISIVDINQRGLTSPVHPDQVFKRRFVARIPADSGVQYGNAVGWLEIGPYPNCPNVPTIFSPRMGFSIEKENLREDSKPPVSRRSN